MMMWSMKPNEKEKKFTWHEFTAFVSRRSTNGQRKALEGSSNAWACYLDMKYGTNTEATEALDIDSL